MRSVRLCRRARRAGGFSYLGVLFVITLIGLLAAKAATAWGMVAQRDRERELLFVGGELRRALEAFARAHATSTEPLPTALVQLLGPGDRLVPVRHLRQVYVDPMTGKAEWGLVRSAQGGIVGVYSLSSDAPVRVIAGTSDEAIDFAHAKSYRDWVFRVRSTALAASAATGQSVTQGGDQNDLGAPTPQWPDGHPPSP